MLLLVNTNTVPVKKVALTVHLEQLVDSVESILKKYFPISSFFLDAIATMGIKVLIKT